MQRLPSPTGIAAPPDGYGSWDEYMLDVEIEAQHESSWMRDEEAIRLEKAFRLAPTLAIARALLQGQDVPASQLDPRWRRRYGL